MWLLVQNKILTWENILKRGFNALGRFIDQVKPRDHLQSYARLCVEVDLEKGIPK
jgi:hypothetical protein